MSVSPSLRLLWLTGLVLVPACALPAIMPGGAFIAGSLGFLLAALAALDVLASRHALDRFTVLLPATVRAVINEEQAYAVELHSGLRSRTSPRVVRIAVALPPGIDPVRDDVCIPAPEPAKGVSTELLFKCAQRGEYAVTQAFTGCHSLLGFWQVRKSIQVESRILVQPALARIAKQTAKLLASHRHGGERIVARSGRGREFEQLREYVPSDDFGDIDWKATARRRTPIVREFRIERTQDIYACIDFSRLSAREIVRKDASHATLLDEYVRSTLMLHCAVRQAGDRFGFATFSNRVRHFVKAANANSFDSVFRQALYPLRPHLTTPAFDEMCATLRSRAKRRALVVFFTGLAEPQLAESFLAAARLLARQHLVIAACPVDAHVAPLFSDETVEAPEDIYGKLAGHLLWKKLAELRVQLRSSGIRMQIVTPGRLGLAAATEYLDIKERQLL